MNKVSINKTKIPKKLSPNYKRSVIIGEARNRKKYKPTQKQLDNMAKGRKLNPNGVYKGYFKIKFDADMYIIEKAKEYIKNAKWVFNGRDMYNYLISLKHPYITERLTHNHISGILFRLNCIPIKFHGGTRGMWTTHKNLYNLLQLQVRDHFREEYGLTTTQARILLNYLLYENKKEFEYDASR